jgi:hypothetical protein
MKYLALKHKTISLASKGQTEFNAGENTTLVPDENSKVFIHWKTDSGKLASTYTMTFPTRIEGNVTLINALDKPVNIKAVW